ncbi:MAG: hypothetical protein KatS3mg008_0642 [Acidimicrobiales bacterium]|nr:MAG: hypothetical protein KatS3mg008_0642 [Acidimicrobiales bacterium]
MVALWLVTSCGPPPADRSPGPRDLKRIDLDPVATLAVGDDGFSVEKLEVRVGDPVELTNTGSSEHEFDAGEDFRTGDLFPGESTLLLVPEPHEGNVIRIRDRHSGDTAELLVRPSRRR